MKAEEQLKQSMQELHLSTEAKNRILATVVSAPAAPEKRKKPFYCSKVFTRIAGAAAAVIVVVCVLTAVSRMTGVTKGKDESAASAPYEQEGMRGESQTAEIMPSYTIAFSVNVKANPAVESNVYSPGDPVDSKTDVTDNTEKKHYRLFGWATEKDYYLSYQREESPGTSYYAVQKEESGNNSDISFATQISLAFALQKKMDEDYPAGTCYILSVSEALGVYTVKFRYTETVETAGVYIYSESDIPATGRNFTAVVSKDPVTAGLKVDSIKEH